MVWVSAGHSDPELDSFNPAKLTRHGSSAVSLGLLRIAHTARELPYRHLTPSATVKQQGRANSARDANVNKAEAYMRASKLLDTGKSVAERHQRPHTMQCALTR
jgi:hypothetical protein